MAYNQQRTGGAQKNNDDINYYYHDIRESRGSLSISGQHGIDKGPRDVYFIIPRKVTVLYGPYMFQGMMDYRTERLQGLKAFLEKLGVTVELTPCLDYVNLCRVWFLDEPIFSCKITDLIFGGDGELDPVCWRAAESLEHYIKKVLKGLKKQKPLMMTSEELKKPFCPCFQVDRSLRHQQQRKSSVLTSTTGKTELTSSRDSTNLGERSLRNSQDTGKLGDEETFDDKSLLTDAKTN